MRLRYVSLSILAGIALSILPGIRAGEQLQLQPALFVFKNSDFRDVSVEAPAPGSVQDPSSPSEGHTVVIKSPSTIRFDNNTLVLQGSEFRWSTGDAPPRAINPVPVPTMKFALNQSATIRCVVPTQYMEKRADGTFNLREIASDSPDVPRYVLSFHVEPGSDATNELLVTCRPEIATIRGREKIPGVDLEIGRPLMSSFNDEIKLAVKKDEWSLLLFRAPRANDYSVMTLFKIDNEPAPSTGAGQEQSPVAPNPGPGTSSGTGAPQSTPSTPDSSMKTPNKLTKAIGWPMAVASAASVALAAKADLSRETPVPATEQVPIVDFFRPPLLREPKLNLAGTHIAAILSADDDHTEVIVYDFRTQAIDRIGVNGADDIPFVDWLDSKRLIFGVSYDKLFPRGLFAADVAALQSAYPLIQFAGARLIAVPTGDRLHPVVHLSPHSQITGRYGEVAILRTDFPGGREMSAIGHENATKHIVSRYPVLKMDARGDFRYLTDHEGKLAFGFGDQDGILSLHQLVGDTWEQCPVDLEEINVVDSGNHPGEIVVVGKREGGRPRPLQVMDAASGKVRDVLWEDPAYDFDGRLYRDAKTNDIVGAMGNTSAPYSVWFTEAYRSLQQVLEKRFPGQVIRILGTDEAGRMVLIATFSDRQPTIYSWVDLEKHTAGMFRNSRPWIDPQRMQPMGVRKYKNRDGKEFDAYLTLPKGATIQNPPPLVVLPHDRSDYGRGGRSTWGYDSEVQFLASRGYAVLQPNYRGSAGLTWMYPKEDEWAFRKMHEDVTDATRDLIASGLVDRNRVAIMGTGFGGYLALCGAAFEPSLYRCAIAVSAHYDWGKLIEEGKYSKYADTFYFRMLLKLGDPSKETEKFDAMSPLKHADDIRVPVLVSYGEYDSSAEISMAKDLISTVQKKGIAAESIRFRDEGGRVRYLDHKVELYQGIETYLAKNLAAPAP